MFHLQNPENSTAISPAALHLRLLQTSDLHGALRGYDYLADRPSHVMGLSRTATLIRGARAGAPNSLLFDCGDFLQGSPVCDLAARGAHAKPGGARATHPMIAAMNALDYDAVTIGNHDFNHGADFLFQSLETARFPVVSANFLTTGAGGGPVFAPRTHLTRELHDTRGTAHRLVIAVIGCLPPQTVAWDHQLSDRFTTSDMVQAVREQAALARTEGADLVIVLAHSGIDPSAPTRNAENALLCLAALDDVDIVLGGHTHEVFPTCPGATPPAHPAIDAARGLIHGTPVLMPGFWGNHLGQLDLTLAPAPSGGWRLTGSCARMLPIARRDVCGALTHTTPEDPALLATTEGAHTTTLRHIQRTEGSTARPLHSFFSLLANDSALQLVADAQGDHLARAVRGSALADLPILSSVAPFKTGRRSGPQHFTHISPGPLTRRGLADLYSYPNTLVAVHLTGAALRDWLEHGASVFSRLTPGRGHDAPLLDDAFPGYRFEVVCGVTYRIDLSRPARFDTASRLVDAKARRIRDLRFDGRPVSDDDEFLLSTNSFRAFGIGLSMLAPGVGPAPRIAYETRRSNRDILLDYIRRQSPLDRTARHVWSFAPLDGASAWFDTAPEARAYLDDPMLPALTDMGNTPRGFARFRVTL